MIYASRLKYGHRLTRDQAVAGKHHIVTATLESTPTEREIYGMKARKRCFAGTVASRGMIC
jgi:hypothetical protein